MRVRLKGVHKVKMQLASGESKLYYYAWRGGPKLKGEPGTAEFMRSYTEAHEKKKAIPQGTMFTLIAEFKASSEYTSKSASTKRAYTHYLKLIESEFGDMPLDVLSDPECRGEFKAWRDTMSDKPRTADYAWTTLARVLSVAKDRGRIRVNPCERGGRLYDAERSEHVWSEADVAKLLSVASKEMETVMMLALWTGQRQGDLLTLPWSAYDGTHIRLRQSKTGRSVVIPAAAQLRAALDKVKKVGPLILNNSRGTPWTSSGFRASWGKLCAKAGIEELTFHDIRGSAVVRLAIAEASVPEIATFTGHSLKDVEAILDKHYLGRDVRLAESAVRKLERNGK